jgi:uncharacterized protein involved in outer membrane biogenesis
LKRLLILILILASLVATISVGGYLYLSSQDHDLVRSEIQNTLQKTLGRSVTIKGPLRVEFGLFPTVSLSDITVANAEWGTGSHLLTVNQLSIQPRILPLLKGEIVLNRMDIQGVDLWLENDRSGRQNWALPLGDKRAAGDARFRVRSISGTDVVMSYLNTLDGTVERIDLDQILFRGADKMDPLKFEIAGEVEGMPLALTGTIGSVSELVSGDGFNLQAKARVGDTTIDAQGKIGDQDFRDFDGTQIHLKARGRRPALLLDWTDLPIPEVGRFEFELDLNGEKEQLRVENLQATLSGGDFEVAIDGRIDHLPEIEGLALNFRATGRTPSELVPAKKGIWPDTDKFSLAGNLSGNRHKLAVDDLNLALTLGSAKALVQGSIGDVLHGEDLDLSNRITGQDIAVIGEKIQLPLPDLDFVDIQFRYSGRFGSPAVSDIRGSLREGDIEAHITGRVDDVVRMSGFDLSYDLEGTNLDQLSSLVTVELPVTDQVKGSGKITGQRHDLTLSIGDAEMTLGDLRLRAGGVVTDLLDVPRVNLDTHLTGRSLADVDFGEADVVLPVTDSFSVTGRAHGLASSPDIEQLTAWATVGDIRLEATGRLNDIFRSGGGRLDLKSQIKGTNLAELGKLIDEKWLTTDSFAASGRATGTWHQLAIDELEGVAKTPNSDLAVSGRVGDVLSTRDVDIRVDGRADSARAVLPWESPIWDRLGALTTRFQVVGGPEHYGINVDELQIGKSQLQGRFDFTFRRAGGVTVRGSFAPGTLDITPWVTSTGDNEKRADGSGSDANQLIFGNEPLPLEWMDDLTLDIQLDKLTLALGTGHVDVVDGDLVLASRNLNVDPFELTYLGTSVSGGMTLDARQEPELRFRARGIGFDLGSLARRIGWSETAQGKVDLKFSAKTSGHTPRKMASSADGRLSLLIAEGLIPDASIPLHLSETVASFIPGADDHDGIHILCGMVDLPFDDGIGRSNVLVLDTRVALIRGEGEVNLRDETLDVRLVPRAKRARSIAHNVDVKIYGHLRNPQIRANTLRAAGSVARTAGRFALLGPLGLFVSTDTFRDTHQECATTLAEVEKVD